MKRHSLTITGLLIALAAFLLVNMISRTLLSGVRADLTENHLYTLSEGSRRVVAALDEPVMLRFCFTERQAADVPPLRAYAQRVRGLLEEFVASSKGKVQLQVLDPEPFSEEEDEVVQAGLQGVLIDRNSREPVYFGLIATGSTDEQELIPFFDPGRESSVEYDISRLIHKLGTPERPVLAVVSSLPLDGAPGMGFPGAPPGKPPWFIMDQLRDMFDVRVVQGDAEALPDDTSLLFLVHPKELSDAMLRSIDQFVLGGGHALILVDPHCERDEPPPDPSNQFAAMMADRGSNLEPLFAAWGLELVPGQVVGDRQAALTVRSGTQARPEPVPYVLWMELHDDALNKDDFVTAELGPVDMATVGALRQTEDSKLEWTPLITSSADSMLVDVNRVRFRPDPKGLLTEFVPGGGPYTLAVRISGDVSTAFPEPASDEATDGADDGADDGGGDAAPTGRLTQSVEPINVIVAADVDWLADDWWVQVQNLLGTRFAVPTASNGDFVMNALENLSGSHDLISVRSRASYERPFDRIEALRRDAEQRFLAEEQRLQDKLKDTERQIDELQSKHGDSTSLILGPEEREAIDGFRAEQVATRKKLRQVQHDLRKDIDSLEAQLKLLNIGGVPLLVAIAAMVLSTWRSRKRS